MTNNEDNLQMIERHRNISRACAAEGIVLLQNDGTLPLKEKARIALFGGGARHTRYGGTGSSDVDDDGAVSICEALKMRGFRIVTDAWLDRYDNLVKTAEAECEARVRKALFPPSKSKIMDALMWHPNVVEPEIIKTNVESAPAEVAVYVISRVSSEGEDRTPTEGDYYLSEAELRSVRRLAESYAKLVLIINTGGPIDMSFVDEIPGINSIIYVGLPGGAGPLALADIMLGKISPSGKLSQAWPMRYGDVPGGQEFAYGDPSNVEYKEETHVGYRFYDAVGVKPRYEFGYGLSYGNFRISEPQVSRQGRNIRINVRVSNTGNFPGKEVVQVYFGPVHSASGEARELLGFRKTPTIQPASSQVVSLTVDTWDMARFSPASGAFVLPEGYYVLHIGSSQRNIIAKLRIYLDKAEYLTREMKSGADDARRNRLASQSASEIIEKMGVSDMAELCVGKGFLNAKRPVYTPGAVGHTKHFPALGINNIELADGPCGLRLMSYYAVTKNGKHKIVSPEFKMMNYLPPMIKKMVFADPEKCTVYRQPIVAFPTPTVMAQTWNMDLLERAGRAISEEMSAYGVTILLAPGLNIQRNPLCGRNFEYYSEDPLLAGKCAAATVRGVQAIPGHMACVKHFACNNMERNRMTSNSVVSEKALRDVYLRGFEIAIREGNPGSLMTSYNLINGQHAAEHKHLLTEILRGEWGYDGIVMTDWTASNQTSAEKILMAGGDLIMPGSFKDRVALIKALRRGELKKKCVKQSALRILRAIAATEK